MKKLLLFLSLSLSCAAQASDLYPLLEAIDHSNLSNVESLITMKNSFTKIEKDSLMEAARDAIELRKQKLTFFRSGKDFLRVVCGLYSIAFSCAIFGGGITIGRKKVKESRGDRDANILAAVGFGIGAGGTVFGVWQMVRGFNLHSAYTKLTSARVIQNLINKLEVSEKIVETTVVGDISGQVTDKQEKPAKMANCVESIS